MPTRGRLVRLLLIGALIGAACGRSPGPDNALRISTVVGEREQLVAGAAGVRVWATLVNDTSAAYSISEVNLTYRGAGTGFAAQLLDDPTTLPGNGELTVPFVVRLPTDGSGSAIVDGAARLSDVATNSGVILSRADEPMRFSYADPDPLDLDGLPSLLVTTADDEIDGGAMLVDPIDAGGIADLSLREAVQILVNRGEAHRIQFDPRLFASGSSPTLTLEALGPLPVIDVAGAAIDGLGSEVRIAKMFSGAVFQIAAPRVVVRGLTVYTPPGTGGNRQLIDITAGDDVILTDLAIDSREGSGGGPLVIRSSARVMLRRLNMSSSDTALSVFNGQDVSIGDCTTNHDILIASSTGTVVHGLSAWRALLTFVNSPASVVMGSTFVEAGSGDTALSFEGTSGGSIVTDTRFLASPDPNTPSPRILLTSATPVTISRTEIQFPTTVPWRLDAGANPNVSPPVIESAATAAVSGSTTAADDSRVEVYADPDGGTVGWVCDATVIGGSFSCSGLDLAVGDQVRASVTDASGQTSELSDPVTVP